MSGAQKRMEYFWLQERVVARRAERQSGFGPWPLSPDQEALVASIEDGGDSMHIINGVQYSPERLSDAIMLHHGLPPSNVGTKIDVPRNLVSEFEQHVEAAITRVTKNFQRLGSEDRMTGALFDKLEASLHIDGWSVNITAHHYSNVVKENRNGADAGIIIDIVDGNGGRVYKVLLIQAKRAASVPADVKTLPRVAEQRRLMKDYTTQGYIWVYTPGGITAFGPDDTKTPLEPAMVLADTLRCTRGDQEKRAIVNAFDSQHLLEVVVGP